MNSGGLAQQPLQTLWCGLHRGLSQPVKLRKPVMPGGTELLGAPFPIKMSTWRNNKQLLEASFKETPARKPLPLVPFPVSPRKWLLSCPQLAW